MATIKQLTDAYAAVNAGRQPSPEILGQLTSLANLSVNGPISDAQALGYILNSADKTTSLALLSYQFFTGKSPTKEGLAYLTNSPDNPNDLNDAYYAGFSLEDRYINFAGNLATAGDSAKAFAAKYGALDFAAYVASIYETIVGAAYASAAGQDPAKAIVALVGQHDALLAKAQAAGLITANSSAAQIDLALKAVTAGYLMSQTVQSDVGLYASAANSFMIAEIKGTATYNTDLAASYAAAPGKSGGDGHIAGSDFSFTPPPPPKPPVEPKPSPQPEPQAPAAFPQSFTLTTGADTFTGFGGDDTFTGAIALTGTTVGPTSTFDPVADVLDGAGGYDTLALTVSGSAAARVTIDPTKVTNIERLSVAVTATGTTTIALALTSSFSELVSTQNQLNTTFTGFGSTVTKLGVSNQRNGTIRFTVDNTTLTGPSDALTLTLTNDGSATTSPAINLAPASGTAYYETLNIVSAGTLNSVALASGTTQTSLAKLNISGAAPLTLNFAFADNLRNVPTIDATAATGGVTIGGTATGNSLGAVDQTVILGTGPNVVNFGGNLTAGDTVDGSRGSDDTIAIVGNVTNTHVFDHVTGVENIRFAGQGGTSTQDVQLLPTGMALQLGGGTGNVVLTNLANNTSLEVFPTSNTNLALFLANDTGADALTLRFNSAATSGTALYGLSDIAGLETMNIVSTGPGTQNIISDDGLIARHVITGDVALSISANNANLTSPMTVDATAFTARLDFTSSQLSGAAGVTFLMGSGGGTLTGGAGVDRYVLGIQGQNTSTYYLANVQGGNDTVAVVGNVAAGTGAATNYLSPFVTADIRQGSSNVSGVTLVFSADDHDFSLRNAAGTAFTGLAKGAVSHGLTAGDSIITQNLAQSGVAVAATNVAMINLTTGTSFASDAKTLFQTAIGAGSITGLAADSNYLVSVYDLTNHRTVIAVVNTGASGAGDTVLSAADFTDSGMAMVSVILTGSSMANVTLGPAF